MNEQRNIRRLLQLDIRDFDALYEWETGFY